MQSVWSEKCSKEIKKDSKKEIRMLYHMQTKSAISKEGESLEKSKHNFEEYCKVTLLKIKLFFFE